MISSRLVVTNHTVVNRIQQRICKLEACVVLLFVNDKNLINCSSEIFNSYIANAVYLYFCKSVS